MNALPGECLSQPLRCARFQQSGQGMDEDLARELIDRVVG
jgi:hypothetical protein